MARFYTSNNDTVIEKFTYNQVEVPIRVNSAGVFYAELFKPSLVIKDRNLLKVRKELERELTARGSGLSIPFLRMTLRSYGLEWERKKVTKRTDRGGYTFVSGNREQPITTRYGDEFYLPVLTIQQREEIEGLYKAKQEAELAFDRWLEVHEFDCEAAAKAQANGEYPTEHPIECESDPDEQ